MEKEVSEKNTKVEILKAYESLLKDVQQAKQDVPKQQQEEKVKKETLEKVADINNESILKSVVSLKSNLNNSLDELTLHLTEEFKKLENIRAAISLEKKSLDDLYSLSANTDSLAAMLLAQKEKRESFEQEISDKRTQWEQEKAKHETTEKEYLAELQKSRKRDEEEYAYNQKIKRQKEQDIYDNQKAELEKELKEKKITFDKEIAGREQALKITENELSELRKNNTEFPEKLEKSLKEKETEISEKLKTKYDFDIQIIKNQNES
ncbi:MAG: hypothetical protein LBN95_07850, partial [Prevotellaceae bacterium]|nr:hypothetical protein [Prevotellaceae bacterium]